METQEDQSTSTEDLISAFTNTSSDDTKVLQDLSVIKSLISRDECEKIVKSLEKMGMKPLTSQFPLRKTNRIIIDSTDLAEAVWKKVEDHIPFREVRDEYGDIWRLCGLNERFRFCSYGKGDHFKAHCDGFWQSSFRKRSFATLMIYLNDVDDDLGGSTRFLDYGLYIRPRAGNAVVFLTDDLLHDGEEIRNVDNNVFRAEKYIMRTDIMYECKKFRNSDMRKRIYEMREEAHEYQERGDDTKAVELWEEIIRLEDDLRKMNLGSETRLERSDLPSEKG